MKTFNNFGKKLWVYAALLCCAGFGIYACSPRGKGGDNDYRRVLQRVRGRSASARSIEQMKKNIMQFQVDLGRSPTNLYELVNLQYMAEIPSPPDGFEYSYDPFDGRVEMVQTRGVLGGGDRRSRDGSPFTPR